MTRYYLLILGATHAGESIAVPVLLKNFRYFRMQINYVSFTEISETELNTVENS